MDIAFLKRVLPDQGWRCLIGLDIDGGRRTNLRPAQQLFAKTWEELETHAQTLADGSYNVYFACSSFASPEGRTKKNARQAKSFWMDLDVGEGSAKFESKTEATNALLKFCEAVSLPTPTIVDSGGGLHIYWILDEPIDSATWLAAATKLKGLCKEHNFKADPVVTNDSARILRVPGTLNYKTDPEGRVYVVEESPDIPFSVVEAALGSIEVLPESFESKPPRSPDESFNFRKILQRTKDGDGCAQLLWILEHPDKTPEPVWRAGLSIAVNCENPDKWVHAMSQGHPDYDEGRTNAKADKAYDYPHGCSYFDENNPAICEKCPHYNEGHGIPGGPLRLGLVVKEATYTNGKTEEIPEVHLEEEEDEGSLDTNVEALSMESTEPLDANLSIIYTTPTSNNPELPEGYYLSSEGRLFKRRFKKTDVCLNDTGIYVLGHVVDPEAGRSLRIRFYESDSGQPTEIFFPTKYLASKDKFIPQALDRGLNCHNEAEVRVFLKDWWKSLQRKGKGKEIMRRQMGWTDFDHKSFVIGDVELSKKGVKFSPTDDANDDLVEWTKPKGDIEKWKEAVNVYSDRHFEPYAFAFLSAFGSVLLSPATGHNGVLISLVSSGSGTGKSTVLKCINSVFGHPEHLMAQETDTFAAKMARMGLHNSISFTLDEATNLTPIQIGKLLYQVSQGRGPDRLQSQVNALRKNNTRWRSICVSTGNTSMLQQLSMIKKHAEGENMRILEYNLDPSDKTQIPQERAQRLFDTALYSNYGLAGKVYVDWVIKNLPQAVRLVQDIRNRLREEGGIQQRERFWSAAISCNVAACAIAKRLGLIDIDPARVLHWATRELLENLRSNAVSTSVNFDTVLGMFLNEIGPNTLIINENADKRATDSPAPFNKVNGPIVARWNPDAQRIYVTTQVLRDYCSKNQYMLNDMKKNLAEQGMFLGRERTRLTKGTELPITVVEAYVFVCTEDMMSVDLKDLQQQSPTE
jgi:hypothetical protein